ncbi:Gfo/Idh/MocA family oxidoreductase [Amycolatopsis sp. DR6-1]|uniref:Gfo/Idh/MocA family oxidoreductase n=1 Tax=Amycolatopsis dendrobii TaxID=2760662 RepID=A0A7W3VVE1_9PSEU|nr:Gfo/Idh/MocA family oxidoreductase [Amycolatopsis dendrobii]
MRIGVLGAARVVKQALTDPAKSAPEITVAAIAARDPARARERAARLGIPKVHESYEALLADPDLDAVYVPLPNALHAEWSIRAMEAGKHVLCEKPIASNEDEARRIAGVAAKTGRVICEAMHPLYHGLFDRVAEIMADGTIGEIRHVSARVCFPVPNSKDIRWQYPLGGGALMDLGVYAVAVLRALAGADPAEVTHARAKTRVPGVDRSTDARLRFPGGATGRIKTVMWGWPVFSFTGRVEGTKGKLTVRNPIAPQAFNRIVLETGGKKTSEQAAKLPGTYTCELNAFAAAILRGEPLRTGPEHFVPVMGVIDEIYRRAGLPVRGASLSARSE